jgi:hypothetical protein
MDGRSESMRGNTSLTIGEILTMKASIRKPSLSVTAQMAEQLRRAFDGSAWHGPSMLELLEDVDAETAAAESEARRRSLRGKRISPQFLKAVALPSRRRGARPSPCLPGRMRI